MSVILIDASWDVRNMPWNLGLQTDQNFHPYFKIKYGYLIFKYMYGY